MERPDPRVSVAQPNARIQVWGGLQSKVWNYHLVIGIELHVSCCSSITFDARCIVFLDSSAALYAIFSRVIREWIRVAAVICTIVLPYVMVVQSLATPRFRCRLLTSSLWQTVAL
jgi:hypothetical protein